MKHRLCALLMALALALPALSGEAWDVGVAWLERNPKYPVDMKDVGGFNRPAPGDVLTWTAHLYSNSPENSLPEDLRVKVSFKVNTAAAGEAEAVIGPDGFGAASISWTVPEDYAYDFGHALTNYVEAALSFPGHQGGDRVAANDSLSVCMDALVFSVKVNRKTFAQYTDPAGLSFFDRLNGNIDWMNRRFAAAKYPLSPDGIIDRYRIDVIEFTDLEYEPDLDSGDPAATTRLFFFEGGKMGAFYNAPYYWIGQTYFYVRGSETNGIFSTMGMGAVTHEAGHSLQLPDTYIFDLDETANGVTHERIVCDWMDSHGLVDIMRYPYLEESNFTELSAVAANTQAGVFRRQTPEIMSYGDRRYVGWMFRCLPKSFKVRFFAENGQELAEGTPVKLYQCDRTSYYISVSPEDKLLDVPYRQGGIAFTPDWEIKDDPNVGKNTFLVNVELPGGGHYARILDQLRFNYRYIKGETEEQVFAFTNAFRTVSLVNARLSLLDGGKHLLLKALLDDSEGAALRWAGSPAGLAGSPYLPARDAILSRNWLKDGENLIYLQARSRDGFETPVKVLRLNYDAAARALREGGR